VCVRDRGSEREGCRESERESVCERESARESVCVRERASGRESAREKEGKSVFVCVC